MKKIIAILMYLLFWIVDLLLAAWIFIQSREVIQGLLGINIRNANFAFQITKEMQFIDRIAVIFLAIGWLIFMIVVEECFRNGAGKGDLVRRFLCVTGPVIVVILSLDIGLLLLQGISTIIWERWILLVLELVIAGLMIWYGYFRISKTKKGQG
jgi:hypothetical protein